ncbi:MAG: hypothetical protein LBT62_03285 [Deltaproteobacteria bacterium]|nr:hypothetical protein [Deltaproteobacteria bacterium]
MQCITNWGAGGAAIVRRTTSDTGFSAASLPFDRHGPQSHVSGLKRQGYGLWNTAQTLGRTLEHGRSKRRLEEQIKRQTDGRHGKATTNFVLRSSV